MPETGLPGNGDPSLYSTPSDWYPTRIMVASIDYIERIIGYFDQAAEANF